VKLTGLVAVGDQILAAGLVGGRPQVWAYAKHRWRAQRLPNSLANVTGITALILAGNGSTTALVADEPTGPALWVLG
jgi:hypothetical protein